MSSKKVVIVGAGAAGIFTAYRLREMYGPTAYDVTIVEARNRIGGNCYKKTVVIDGVDYSIDCGAQFFFRRAQISYVELLRDLNLIDDPTKIIEAESGFIIWDSQKQERRLHIPDTFGGLLSLIPQWFELGQFLWFLVESRRLDRSTADNWDLSVDDWLQEVEVTEAFKRDVIKPFLYQFVSLPPDRIGEASARYATTYFARNALGEPGVDTPNVDPADLKGWRLIDTYQSLIGLDGILQIALDKSGAKLEKSSPIVELTRLDDGSWEVTTEAGDKLAADHVVLATDPPTSAKILEASQLEPELVSTLKKIEYANLDIAMQHGPPCYMPQDPHQWEPVNTIVDGDNYMFTAWFGPLRENRPDGKPIQVFKSWGANLTPATCASTFFTNHHQVIYPTTTSVNARDAVMKNHQGSNNLWFVGGWTNWFDSQEACLDSASRVAHALEGAPAPGTGRIVRHDAEELHESLRRSIRHIRRVAPDDHAETFDRQLEKLEP